jgi:hypothetical protein
MKSFEVEVTVPEGLTAGDTFRVKIEAPVATKKNRGVLAGVDLDSMTEEQLKRELINSKSVLYKAIQRGAAAETIANNQARVDAATAVKAAKFPSTTVAKAVAVAVSTEMAGLLEEPATEVSNEM